MKVCKRWLKFENFLADMGERPKIKSLGRFLDTGNYTPRNCKWMTESEQGLEKRKHYARTGGKGLGVYFNINRKKWVAYCTNDKGIRRQFGSFSTKEEALAARKLVIEAQNG